jgi:hypothetical protein
MNRREEKTQSAIGTEEPFFERWARRKAEARQQPAELAPPAGAVEPEAPAEQETGAVAEPVELPPLESLGEDSNYGAFLAPGVDPALRRQALRQMFRAPKYHVIDSLDPFRADFSNYAGLGDIVTADMRYHAERLLRKELEEAGQGTPEEIPEREVQAAAPESPAEATDPSATGDEEELQRDS